MQSTLAATFLIAREVVHEALRMRLAWVLAGLCALAFGLAGFIGAVALTDTRATQTALLAALLRLAAIFIVAGFTVTSIVREADEQGQQLLLALPLPRAAWLLGKLAGLGLVALAPALLFGALAFAAAPAAAALAWSVSLWCELWIVAAFALLAALGLSSALAALAATLAFYLLARAIGGFQLLAEQRGGSALLDLIGTMLPRLDGYASADWLVYGQPAPLGPILLHSAIAIALLAALALADLYRKEL